MYSLDEIKQLKEMGFDADDILKLSTLKNSDPKKVEQVEEKQPEKVEEKEPEQVEEKQPENDSEESTQNPLNELKSFNDKIDDLLNQIKINNINNKYIEQPEPLKPEDILANVINPMTKEEIK